MRSGPGDGIVGEQVGWVRKLQEERARAQPEFGCADGKLDKPSEPAHGNVGSVDCRLPGQFPGGPLRSGSRAVGFTSPGPPLTTCSAWSDTAPGRRCGCAGKSPQEVKMMWGGGACGQM